MLFGYSQLETVDNIMNSERQYSGVNFELQFLSRPQGNANWRGNCDFRWGDLAKSIHLKTDVNFWMLLAGNQ